MKTIEKEFREFTLTLADPAAFAATIDRLPGPAARRRYAIRGATKGGRPLNALELRELRESAWDDVEELYVSTPPEQPAGLADIDGVPKKTADALADHELSIETLDDLRSVDRGQLEAALEDVGASTRASKAILGAFDGLGDVADPDGDLV